MTTLSDIATLLKCSCPAGVERRTISGMAAPAEADAGELTLATADSFVAQLQGSSAAAVIAPRRLKLPPEWDAKALRVDDAELAVAAVLKLFAPPSARPPTGIDADARVAPSAVLADAVAIGPFVVIGQRARIGRGSVLHAGVIIGDDTVVGDDCELLPNVVVRERITLGNRVVIHAASVLGTDGFGYRWDGQQHQKVPQIGTIVVEDDVEIGSCVCIDRAKFGATRIGRGSKIDNQVQIAHNVQTGPHCIIVAQTGIAGSARLGAGVVLGGRSSLRDHVRIGDGAMAAGLAAIMTDVDAKATVSGIPALPHRQSLREQAALRQLPELRNEVRKLQEQVEELRRKLS